MISIIISSYQPKFYDALEKNIAETCGEKYEIIRVGNPGTMGVCEAYNRGAEIAKYENLLFLHEDVLFHSRDWGTKLVAHLQNPETGIIGVAGSDYVPMAPSGWYVNSEKNQFRKLIQNTKDGSSPRYEDFTSEIKHRVFALDGVFLAISKEKFKKLKFSEDLQGFHGYDLDISLHAATKFRNFVITDILIEHFSLGTPNKDWFDATVLVRRKYGSAFNKKHDSEIEIQKFNGFLYSWFMFYGVSFSSALQTMRFVPVFRIGWRGCMQIAKSYYQYFRHQNYFEQKFGKK